MYSKLIKKWLGDATEQFELGFVGIDEIASSSEAVHDDHSYLTAIEALFPALLPSSSDS